MNHYPHHIGDFNNATRHLTVVERAFYRELIELYYQTEKPLPEDDFEWIAKRCLAKSDEEKAIVKAILGEFFKLKGGAYWHTRCEAELHIYKDKIEKAQRAGKMSALTRAKQTLNKRSTDVQQEVNQPRTKNQEPTLKTMSGKPDARFSEFWNLWPKSQRKQGKSKCLSIWKRKGLDAQADSILAHVKLMADSVDWKKEGGKFIPMPETYLNGQRWDGAELDAHSGEKPWFINGWSSFVEKGKKHGLIETDFSTPPEFRIAVLRAEGVTQQQVTQAERDWT